MIEEFCLSEKIRLRYEGRNGSVDCIEIDDVKEFIRLFDKHIGNIHNEIDKQYLRKFLSKLAGEKLI